MPIDQVPSSLTANAGSGTLAVYFSPATPSVAATFSGTTAVYFDQSNPAVTAYGLDGSTKRALRSNSDGAIKIYDLTAGTVTIGGQTSTLNVQLDPGHTLGIIDSINKTITVQFDPGHELGSIKGNSNTLTIFLPDTGHELGTIRGNTNTLTVFIPDTGHELGSIRGITQSVAVYFDRGNPAVAATFSGTLAVAPITGSSHPMWEENYNAQRVFFAGSNPNSSLVVNAGTGTFTVAFDPGHELGSIRGNSNTLTVFLPDTGHELGSIRGNTNTLTVFIPDTGHELGSIRGITNTIAVNNVTATGGQTMDDNYKAQRVMIVASQSDSSLAVSAAGSGTFSVFIPDTGHTLGKVDAGVGTFQVFLPDTGHELGTIRGNTNTLTVFLPDTGHELGTIRGNTNTLTVFFPDTGHTLGKVDQGVAGTVGNSWFVNASHTASIFTTSTTNSSAVSVSGATIISPSASYNFKIFAFSITSTAQSNILVKFTNGAGTSPTEFWRLPLQAPSQGFAGANLAVTPPGYLFATGVNVTLSLVTDSASLVHVSVSYIKESA